MAKMKRETHAKETVESILIAFILAFIFRCFIVEAFVIPTGSMAPTLLGAHMQFRCPDCGYRFTAGYNEQDDTFSVPVRANKTYAIICPNCGMRLPRQLTGDPENDAENPIIRYGDRILVMKYLYLMHPPQRWDVVVFKTPDNRGTPGDYTINYIKRLVGKPRERLFVAEGDLYVSPDTGQAEKPEDFVVQPKPPEAQDALWRIVYDADYVPRGLPRTYNDPMGQPRSDGSWRQPWQAAGGSGWVSGDVAKGVTARQFDFDNAADSGTLAFDPHAIPNTGPLTDWLAYDQTAEQVGPYDTLAQRSYATDDRVVRQVPDLKVSFTLDRFVGDGRLRAVLGKDNDASFALEVSGGKLRLIKSLAASSRQIGDAIDLPAGPVTLSLQNVDYRVAVRVNGVERLATTPADYKPDVNAVVARAVSGQPGPAGFCRIEGDRCRARLSHLQLWRDVYYRDGELRGLIQRGTAKEFPANVVRLGDDEFFTMGDNSYQSSDGRYWTSEVHLPDESLDAPAGVVPGRFLLGKAFFVYWPAGFRAFDQPLGPLPNPPVVPNFGDMRFIR